MARHDVFPPTLDRIPRADRVTEVLGITVGALAVGSLLLAVAHFNDPRNSLDGVVPLVEFVVGVLLGKWEVRRRMQRMTLVVSDDRLGIYSGNALAQVVFRSQIALYHVSAFDTFRMLLAPLVLTVSFINDVARGRDVGFCGVALGLVCSAIFGSLIYSRILCRHYYVPNGTGSRVVMFRNSIILRLDKSNSFVQLAGSNCVHCTGKIVSDLDGVMCKPCGEPLHRACRKCHNADLHAPPARSAYR